MRTFAERELDRYTYVDPIDPNDDPSDIAYRHRQRFKLAMDNRTKEGKAALVRKSLSHSGRIEHYFPGSTRLGMRNRARRVRQYNPYFKKVYASPYHGGFRYPTRGLNDVSIDDPRPLPHPLNASPPGDFQLGFYKPIKPFRREPVIVRLRGGNNGGGARHYHRAKKYTYGIFNRHAFSMNEDHARALSRHYSKHRRLPFDALYEKLISHARLLRNYKHRLC